MHRREFNQLLFGAAAGASLGLRPRQSALRVDGARLNAHLHSLAEFGSNPQGGVSRVAYSDADREGREFVMGLMRAARLDVSVDTAGNVVGRRAGSDGGLRPLCTGSHIDSVPEGGNYDGDVGTLAAIEVAQAMAESGTVTRHPLEVIVFQNEEGGTIGSGAITRGLTERQLDLVSHSGRTLREGIAFIGGDPDRLAAARREPGSVAAYLELHVEQGGVLDAGGLDIGVVEGIVGIRDWDVTVEGTPNHAGTTPMDQRHDALLAAAHFVRAVNQVVTSVPGRQVGTVGRMRALPGAYNVIPGVVQTSLELRDLDSAKIQMLYDRVRTEAERIAEASGTRFTFTETNSVEPALCDTRIHDAIDSAARNLDLRTLSMPSGAGHDAQEMAHLGPIGMLFIPSVGGVSHSPREFSRPEDITNGAEVLLHALIELDRLD
ncbi:MAG: Zn-dependent hydrolase [Gemmatimonadales bacterium]|nr:Zn-dependent hydrolase [Gemmatimonadales bacterium]